MYKQATNRYHQQRTSGKPPDSGHAVKLPWRIQQVLRDQGIWAHDATRPITLRTCQKRARAPIAMES